MSSCMVDQDVYGMACTVKTYRAKAVQPVRCRECGGMIPVGTEYRITYSMLRRFRPGDSVDNHRTCQDCQSVIWAFCCGYIYGAVWEDLYEAVLNNDGAIAWDEMQRLTPGARAKVCDLLEEVWQELEKWEANQS